MSLSQRRLALLALLTCSLGAGVFLLTAGFATAGAGAEGLSDDGGAEWRVEQPEPPKLHPEAERETKLTPIGLGRIGDIEFWSPNRGALITAGNGSTIPPGVWFYNGERWRELATVCGATDGRIAWAGPNEFWTISDGRPGQAAEALGRQPPLEDNTLCHFAPPAGNPDGQLEVVASYAQPAFQSNSYPVMHAAGCLSETDCWFAGEPLPAPQIGVFELHWNGSTISTEPYLPEGHAVYDMSPFEGSLYESLLLTTTDRALKRSLEPPALLRGGESSSSSFEPALGAPIYGPGEFPYALNYLHLSADDDTASPEESALWGAAGPQIPAPEKSAPAGVTVVRYSKLQYHKEAEAYLEESAPTWSQVLGPETEPSGLERFPEDVVDSIAAEPGTNSAWLALDTEGDSQIPRPTTHALVARVSADGSISDELRLPAEGEPYGPKGAVEKIVCPAAHDCWMTTNQGWLLHLSPAGERRLEPDNDPVFSGGPITVRPSDESLPQVPPDAPPADDSGLEETPPPPGGVRLPVVPTEQFATVTLPLLSDIHSRLVHRTTLELSFHLAVRARVGLLAKHRRSVVASTPMRTLVAGNHNLLLRLDIHRWPTKLEFKTHALAPLPTRSTREAGTNVATTSLVFLNALGPLGQGLPQELPR
jgi:hypothetical protein